MTDTVESIDALIKYIESPAYLRMTATAQGEDPSALLAATPAEQDPVTRNSAGCPCGYCEITPTPPVRPSRATSSVLRLSIRQDGPEEYAVPLRDLRPFTTSTNNLRGVTVPELVDDGRLPDIAAYLWQADRPAIDYVVYSYNTPIAWRVTHPNWSEWVFPKTKYSATTSRHQKKILDALGYNRQHVVGFPTVRLLREEGWNG